MTTDQLRIEAASMRTRANSSEAEIRDLVEAHVPVLRRVAAARVGPALADDLVSETFAELWKQLAAGRAPDDVDRPWLVAILLNRCRMHHRSERRWRRRQLRGAIEPDVPGIEDDVAARLDAKRLGPEVLKALAQLSSVERIVITLVACGELTPSEAAIALDMPPATVRSHLSRARQQLVHLLSTPAEDRHDA